METARRVVSSFPFALAMSAVALGASDAAGQQLLSQTLAELDGRVLTISQLVYAPGQSAEPHRHPAYIAAYVVSGQVESGLDDEQSVLYGPGDVWYEAPMQLHRTFRNPSTTEPVTVIVFSLRDPGAPRASPNTNAPTR